MPDNVDAVPSSKRSRDAVARNAPRLSQELEAKGMKLGSPVFIRIFKGNATLEMWVQKGDKFELFRTYNICRFSGLLGPKTQTGDFQAPEGCYYVNARAMNPQSKFHLSFNLGYPNAYDRHHGYTGSALMVHGNCVSIGCYAMGDANIEEIWTLCTKALENGQDYFRVHCFPFELTEEKLAGREGHDWHDFWLNLKETYDYFETHKVPPNVEVRDGKYAVTSPPPASAP